MGALAPGEMGAGMQSFALGAGNLWAGQALEMQTHGGEGREPHGKGLGIATMPNDQRDGHCRPPRACTEKGCKCVPTPLLPKLPQYFSFSNLKKGLELVSDVLF